MTILSFGRHFTHLHTCLKHHQCTRCIQCTWVEITRTKYDLDNGGKFYLEYEGNFFNIATIQEETTIKKSREGQICQLSWPCVDALTCNNSNRFTFGHFFAKIQEFQNGDVTVSRTSVTICIT